MKHAGKAAKAGLKILILTFLAALVLGGIGVFITHSLGITPGVALAPVGFLWIVFAIFTLNFFRDPDPKVPTTPRIVLSPAHGKVDVIGTTVEPLFMGGDCQRISIFLSVIDIHVQNSPVTGKIAYYKYSTGQFLSALKAESAIHNENLLLGFDASDPQGKKIAVRILAGVLARRIVPWAKQGDDVPRGERISLVQFGSRADVYLPAGAIIKVSLGDHVVGGETVLAVFE
jgi:phosphatidylserine decarboxylase